MSILRLYRGSKSAAEKIAHDMFASCMINLIRCKPFDYVDTDLKNARTCSDSTLRLHESSRSYPLIQLPSLGIFYLHSITFGCTTTVVELFFVEHFVESKQKGIALEYYFRLLQRHKTICINKNEIQFVSLLKTRQRLNRFCQF